MNYIDTHSHIHDKAISANIDELLIAMRERAIYTITIGTDYETSLAAKKLAEANPNIYYTIGVHPCDRVDEEFDEAKFRELLGPKCVAIGECGLDYFRLAPLQSLERSGRGKEVDRQQQLFIQQIDFARAHDLPLMLHGRPSAIDPIDNPDGMDAYHDMIDILSAAPSEANAKWGNVHFFVGDVSIAEKFIALGFDFSLGGVLTLTEEYDDMVRFLPIDSIHAETDSPYVVPKDQAGKRVSKINTPLNIGLIVDKIAQLKGIDSAELNNQLIQNAKSLYKIK